MLWILMQRIDHISVGYVTSNGTWFEPIKFHFDMSQAPRRSHAAAACLVKAMKTVNYLNGGTGNAPPHIPEHLFD